MSWWSKLFGRETPEEPAEHPLKFPQTPSYHEVVFEELAVRVFTHDYFLGPHSVPCWSYVTDGMRRQGQKEFVFTLKRRENEPIEEYPHDPLRLFSSIYQLACEGKKVDVGEFTQFRLPKGFLGLEGVVAVAYAPSEKLRGVNYPEKPLAAVLFLEEESELLPSVGSYRVLTRLGHLSRCYPTTPWSDRDRKSVLTRQEMKGSLLGTLPVAYVPWGSVQLMLNDPNSDHAENPFTPSVPAPTEDRLLLRMHQTAIPQLCQILAQIPEDQPFAWVMPPAADADARLVWQPGMKEVEALVPPNSTGTCQTGCFIAFVPTENEPEGGQIIEDGFVVGMKRGSLLKLREALERGERLDVTAGSDRIRFCLHWEQPERPLAALEFGNGLLYQPESIFQERLVSQEQFHHYVATLQQILRLFFDLLPGGTGKNFLFVAAIRPHGQVRFWFDFIPEDFPVEIKRELSSRLEEVTPPEVRSGSIAYAMLGRLWGGSSITPSQSQMVPEEWRHAAVRMGSDGSTQTDDILRAIWPE